MKSENIVQYQGFARMDSHEMMSVTGGASIAQLADIVKNVLQALNAASELIDCVDDFVEGFMEGLAEARANG